MTTCPCCGGRGFVPDPKVCPKCGETFTWTKDRSGTAKGARSDAVYCSHRCAKNAAQDAYRQRQRSGEAGGT